MTSDLITRMRETADPTQLPAAIDMIAAETNRDGLIHARSVAIANNMPRAWVQLMSRRIADLWREQHGEPPWHNDLHHLARVLVEKNRHLPEGETFDG